MKRRVLFVVLLISSLGFLFSACELFENEEQLPLSNNDYLIDYNLVTSMQQSEVQGIFTLIGTQYPGAAGLVQLVQSGVSVYSVKYKTQFLAEPVVASGLVCIPTVEGEYPLLSFQNGTNTLHSEAPSVNYNSPLLKLIESVASTGFLVAFPDYLGFGASKEMHHPYLHKQSTVQSVTDLLLAVEEMLPDLGEYTLNGDLYLMGYSQGGWATLAVAEAIETDELLNEKLDGRFFLKATSCGAGPYDLDLVSKHILSQQTYSQPYFMAYLLNSYVLTDEVDITYSDVFSAAYSGSGFIPGLFNGNNSPEEINSSLSTSIATLFKPEFLQQYTTDNKYLTLKQALNRNSITAWPTQSPKLFVHGQGDEQITPAVSDSMVARFHKRVATPSLVQYQSLPLLGHADAVTFWGILSLQWITGIKSPV